MLDTTLQTNYLRPKSDIIGAIASVLCLIHCLATPLLFVVQSGMEHHDDHGHHHGHGADWWAFLDVALIAIGLLAIYRTSKTTSLKWLRAALYTFWSILVLIILNEKLHVVHVPHEVIYIPTLALAGLHIYNYRYCECEEEACCAS